MKPSLYIQALKIKLKKHKKMKQILSILFCVILSMHTMEGQNKVEKKDVKESIRVKFKDGANPIVFVDGKRFDFPVDLIDPNKIASVSVVKGKAAMEKFNAPNGAILVITKKGAETAKVYATHYKIRDSSISEVFSNDKKPLIIIDGKVSNQKVLKKLNTKDIEKIDVLKGEKSEKEYKTKNGVILITTKKKKKE